MIVAPNWTTLRHVAAGLDANDPVRRKQALKQTLELVVDELPDVHAVRFYTLEAETAIVRLATDLPAKNARALGNLPNFGRAVESVESIWQPEQRQWVYCLRGGEQIVGIFEVIVDELDEDWIVWLEVIGDEVGKSLVIAEGRQQPATEAAGDLLPQTMRLINASQMLLSASAYDDIATAAMYATGESISGVSLTIFETPLSVHAVGTEGVTDNRRFSAAYATRSSVQRIEQGDSISSLPELSYITYLRQGTPIVIDNVETDAGYLSGWMREFTAGIDARQALIFGLTSDERVVGTIELYSTERHTFTEQEIDLYTALANELGNTILSKRMLQQSLESQQFASQLVKTNKAIAEAETYPEMAAAVLNDLPSDIEAVAIALFNRPFTLMGTPSQLITEAILSRRGTNHGRTKDMFSALDDARVTYFLHEYLEGSMMLLWNIKRPRRPVLAQQLVEQLQQEDVDVITSFGLNMGGSLRGLLVLAGAESLRDTGTRYAGLRALADQLAAVIENRILFQQTKEALDLIQNQYETSSRIFRADALTEILRAVTNFANGDEPLFADAHMVATDLDGTARVVAEIANGEERSLSLVVDIDRYPASKTLSVLEALEVRDVEEDVFLSRAERAQLIEDGIGAFVLLPVFANYALGGLIMLTNPTPARDYVPRDRLRALRSVADQVGVVLENRKLLQRTEASLQEIQTLYEANRAMLGTQTVPDVLRVLKSTLATDADIIVMVAVDYKIAPPDWIDTLMLTYELTDEAGTTLQEVIPVREDELADVRRYLNQLTSNVVFAPRGTPVPGNPVGMLQERYMFQSYATMVIRAGGKISGLVFLLYSDNKPFVESTRRLYEAIADQVSVAIEKQNLLEQSQQSAAELSAQVRVLQTISEFAARINTMATESDLLRTGARALVQTIGVDHSGIVLFNEDMLTGVVASEYPDTGLVGDVVSTKDNPVIHEEFDLREVIIVRDISQTDALGNDLQRDLLASGMVGIMIVPLVGQNGELIGSIGLDVYDEPRAFTPTEIQIAKTIAAQMAVGVQNLRLLMEAQQRAEQLQRITDFSQMAQSTLNLTEMIDAALASVPRLLSVTHASLALYDDLQDALTLVGGWNDVNGERVGLTLGDIANTPGTTTEYVFQTGKYLYVPDQTTNTELTYPHSQSSKTLLAIPLTNRGNALGVMSVGTHLVNAYSDTDIALFQQMVNQMSVAIDNARTYTQSQRVAKNKTLVNEIAMQLQRQNDLSKMVDLTVNEVGRALGAKRGRIRLNTQRPPEDDNGE